MAADIGHHESGAIEPAVGVSIETSMGAIKIVVYPGKAPVSACAFLSFVDDGTLTQLGAFYRVVRQQDNDRGHPAIDVVQGGLRELPSNAVPIEHEATARTGLKHLDGSVSLARGGVGTATGATFFICIGDHPALDAGGARHNDGQGYAVFGCVTSGMDTVRAIHQLPTSNTDGSAYQRGQILEPPVRFLKAART